MPTERLQGQVRGTGSRNYDHERATSRSGWNMASPFSSSERDLLGDLRVPFEALFEQDFEGAWGMPGPLLDSPPDRRQQGRYHGKGTSVLLAGAGDDDQMGEGSGEPTDAQRLAQA